MPRAPVAAAAASSVPVSQSTLTEANLENLEKNFKGESFGSKDMINPFATGMNFTGKQISATPINLAALQNTGNS